LKFFVTGATGFIGSNLARVLLGRGHSVRALVRGESSRKNVEGLDIELVEGDLRDNDLDLSEAMADCDGLFHVAAVYSFWTPDLDRVFEANVKGTERVLRSALKAGLKKVVYTSTESTIGMNGGDRGTENVVIDRSKLHGAYKITKHQAEEVSLDFWRKQGLPVVVVNPTMPIGAYDVKPTPTGQVIVDYLSHKMPAYVNTGMNLVDVVDVAEGHVLAMERGRPGERYILGNRNVSFKEMLGILEGVTGIQAPRANMPVWVALSAAFVDEWVSGRLLGKSPRVQMAAVRAASKCRYHDCTKAVHELGLPQSPVENAFVRAVEWFRQNGYAK
jgi:dihydroflavonol-4-reductase